MLSLVIPTKNRPEFLMRALAYYRSQSFQGPILVGDSSDRGHMDRTVKAIDRLGKNLHVDHHAFPGLDLPLCLQQLMRLVTTPYVVWVADDDFIVPASAYKCLRYLEANPGYSVAHGKAIRIKTEGSAPHGRIVVCTEKSQPVEEAESAASRYVSYMRRPREVYFSIHRTELARAMFEDVDKIGDRRFAIELLPNCVAVLRGKVKELDFLYLVRQINDYRYITLEQADTHAWIARAGWSNWLGTFCDILTRDLARSDGIGVNEAGDVIRTGMSIYIARRLHAESEKPAARYLRAATGPDLPEIYGVNEDVTTAMGVGHVIGKGRLALARLRGLVSSSKTARDSFALQALLRNASKYHDDFVPVFNTVTGEPSEDVTGSTA